MNLQEIKDKFETETKGGFDLEILAYKEKQEFCVVGIVLVGNEWVPNAWTVAGEISSHAYGTPLSLVVKKGPLPKDILCEVWSNGCKPSNRRYSDGNGKFFRNGVDSGFDQNMSSSWDNFKVIENPIRPWLNDAECPIPEGLKFRVFTGGEWVINETGDWDWNNSKCPITAYQILGET